MSIKNNAKILDPRNLENWVYNDKVNKIQQTTTYLKVGRTLTNYLYK